MSDKLTQIYNYHRGKTYLYDGDNPPDVPTYISQAMKEFAQSEIDRLLDCLAEKTNIYNFTMISKDNAMDFWEFWGSDFEESHVEGNDKPSLLKYIGFNQPDPAERTTKAD